MAFSNPIILWGLLALSIPIIIHLFDFRQTKKVFFSNTRFLKEVKETTQRKRKLKEWLILLSRLAFIFFLVMAFSQPYFKGEAQGSDGQVIIYIDNSKSHEGEFLNGTSKFDQAIKLAQDVISKYPETFRFQLFDNSSRLRPTVNRTQKEAEDWLAELSPTYAPSKMAQVKSVFAQEFSNQVHDIYLISDFQISEGIEQQAFEKDSINFYHMALLSGVSGSNVFVDSAYLQSPFYVKGEPNTLVVSLFNSGETPSGEVMVRLLINGESQGSTTISMEANDAALVEFPLNPDLPDQSELLIKLEEYPNTYDNDFYLSLTGQDRISVVELGDQEGSAFLRSVFGNQSLFNFNAYKVANFDYTLLDQSDLIILNGIQSINPALISNLNPYIERGGVVLIFPPVNADLNSYSQLQGAKLLSAKTDESSFAFSNPDAFNPLFRDVFTEIPQNLELPTARPMFNLPGQENTLISLRNGSPFLVASGKENRVLTFASPLSEPYTNLPRHAIFVPLMYKIASLSRIESSQLYYRIDEEIISLKVGDALGEEIFSLQSNGTQIIPAQRKSGNRLILDLEFGLLFPGIFDLINKDKTERKMAFNLSKSESIQNFLTINQLKQLTVDLHHVQLLDSEDLSTFDKKLEKRFQGTPLWKYALILALVFFFTEIVIIRFIR
jgi:hypothetical protein